MNEARRDSTSEFAAWYAASSGEVRRAVVLAVGDADLGEEATAEAFARALVHWSKVQLMDSPRAWVYRVALNEVRSRLRRRRTERRYLQRQRAMGVPHHPTSRTPRCGGPSQACPCERALPSPCDTWPT